MIELKKDQRITLDKGLKNATVELKWMPNTGGGAAFDLDASAFMLGSTGKCPQDEFMVFYNNPASPDGAVASSGDDLDGGTGEALTVDLDRVDQRVQQIVFTVSIYEAEKRRQNFGMVHGSYIRIVNNDTQEEIARYELEDDFSIETAVEFGRIYREGRIWKFQALGYGNPGGLQGLVNKYVY